MTYDYFYGRASHQYAFYRVPKLLFTEEEFMGMSPEAKIMYGLLLDRVSLSASNGWVDEWGRVFIIYTVAEAAKSLGCGIKKAGLILAELENKYHLIERVRQWNNKPNLIYVKNFCSDKSKSPVRSGKNDTTGGDYTTAPGMSELPISKNNSKKNERRKTEYSSLSPECYRKVHNFPERVYDFDALMREIEGR